MLQPHEYQTEAMLSAHIYPRLRTDESGDLPVYVSLAMAGEAGEFAGKICAAYEMHKAPVLPAVLELGDVLWYITAAAVELHSSLPALLGDVSFDRFETLFVPRGVFYLEREALALVARIADFSEATKKAWRDNHPLNVSVAYDHLVHVLVKLAVCARLCNSSLEQVAQANLDKLRGRRARGTERGSGDNR